MKKPVIALIHFSYWIIYAFLICFAIFAYTIDVKDERGIPYAYSIVTPLFIAYFLVFFFLNSLLAFYTSYFVLFKEFFQKRKIFLLIVVGIACILASNLVSFLVISVIDPVDGRRGEIAPGLVLITGIIPGVHALLGLVLRGFITSYGDIRVKEELGKKNMEMELALIKAQINPHFLFNTINNIDVLIRKDGDKASDYLNKLSDILRYMLYETKAEKVAFSKEVENLRKYLELQKIRSSNPDYIHFKVESISDPMIAPMLFMPFVENAVKYAENKKADHAIDIRINATEEQIHFECANAYSSGSASQELKGGLGRDLAEKRLLVLYPGKYQLDVNDSGDHYQVKLVLSLK